MPMRTKSRAKEPVTLNVYDLSPMNDVIYPMGIGLYHSGVVVHGTEYTFGESGVFSHPPQQLENITCRETIPVAETQLSSREVQQVVDDMKDEWAGSTYDAITKNCNHFSEAFVQRLAGVSIPAYVNRLAYIGSAVSCLIPPEQRRGSASDNSQEGGGASSGFTVIAPPSRASRTTNTAGLASGGHAGTASSGGAGASSWISSVMPDGSSETTNETSQPSQAPGEPTSERRAKMLQAAMQRRQQQEQSAS